MRMYLCVPCMCRCKGIPHMEAPIGPVKQHEWIRKSGFVYIGLQCQIDTLSTFTQYKTMHFWEKQSTHDQYAKISQQNRRKRRQKNGPNNGDSYDEQKRGFNHQFGRYIVWIRAIYYICINGMRNPPFTGIFLGI